MKQDIYANRALDFNKLDHREFEEVVYHYFKSQIDKGLYQGIYDNVELSSGVGERGADAMLFLNGDIKGVVQCKKYKTNLSPQLALSEILKYLLYHILEIQQSNQIQSSLIKNIEDFTYFLVASKDFTQSAKLLLSNFNNNWKSENINQIIIDITSVKSFEKLDVIKAKDQIKELLSSISIVMITAVDLDPIIRINPYLQNRYFSLPVLVNSEDSEKNINRRTSSQVVSISTANAQRKTELISNDITRIKSFFGSDESLSIERSEVADILKWVKEKPKENESNIAVVAGNAGMGKTVIISQLYSKLKKENIPVISLKADRLIFNSLKELEAEYDLDIGFEKLFDEILGIEKRGVLLIDQIDALSQALSSDLKPLKFYDSLIQRFNNHPRVKIIISTRIYDLNYDPIIANYKGKKKFIIKAIEKEILLNTLEKFGIKKSFQFTDTFLDLICVPLHLDVFFKVYTESLDIDEIKSLQDLYSELWKQKILDVKSFNSTSISSKKLSEFVFKIASKMYKLQEINLGAKLFEDEYFTEINFLKSTGILADNDDIEFFHQSFFDYSFARNFVNAEKDLLDDILLRHQGLFIRSKIKQILNYKSSVLSSDYILDINKILKNKQIRFHLKLLVLQQIAFQEKPSVAEQNTVEYIVFKDPELRSAFTSLLMGEGWLPFFTERDVFRKDIEENNESLQSQITRSFRRFTLSERRSDLLKYYDGLKDSSIKDELILDYFWQVNEIKEELAIKLIENVFSRYKDYQRQYWFYRVLEHAVDHFPKWVAKELHDHIDIKRGTDISDDRNYFYSRNQGSQIYELLWTKYPNIAYELVKYIILEIISKRKYDRTKIVSLDSAYLLYDRKNIDLYKHYEQIDMLQKYLEDTFLINPDFVRDETVKFLQSNNITEIIIGFSVVYKYPKEFVNEAYLFFTNVERLQELYSLNQYLNYMILEVFGTIYHILGQDKKNIIEDDILSSFRKNSELRVFTNDDGSKTQNKWFGIGKYELLSSINAKGELSTNFKKEYQELYRKFGKIENQEPEGVTVHINRDPINARYDKLSIDDWRNSFKTYTYSNKKFDSWNQPSEYEHGRKFVNVVSENPNKFKDFIFEMIEDDEISNTYVVKALEGLKEGRVDVEVLKMLFLKALNDRTFDKENTLYLVWLTRYFSESQKVYPEILDFLKENIIEGDEGREDSKDALSAGINSVRGAAVSSLVDYSFSKDTIEFICQTLELLIDNSKPSTRAAAIYKMQYLLKYGEERILNLFLKLASDYHSGVLKISINPLQYLVHYKFEKLVSFFKKALKIKESHKEIGKLITVGYCNEYSQADILLELFLKENEPNSIIRTAFEFISNEHKIDKALYVISRFLDSKSKEVGEIYNRAFFHIKPEQFSKIREFLFEYVESSVGKWREYAFYDFLQKCSGEYYNDCIALASKYKNHHEPNITQNGLTNEPLKVIINSYNSIREYDKTSTTLEQALDVFDDILKNENYRGSSAHQILKDIDAY